MLIVMKQFSCPIFIVNIVEIVVRVLLRIIIAIVMKQLSCPHLHRQHRRDRHDNCPPHRHHCDIPRDGDNHHHDRHRSVDHQHHHHHIHQVSVIAVFVITIDEDCACDGDDNGGIPNYGDGAEYDNIDGDGDVGRDRMTITKTRRGSLRR
jgi:hypothetical protein